jgi:hypothetical protein
LIRMHVWLVETQITTNVIQQKEVEPW